MSVASDVTIDRDKGIGSSDTYRLMRGDWLSLYEEKLGISQPEDLSENFAVQLGSWTEPLHVSWLRDKYGLAISNPTKRFETSSPVPMFAHLDAMIEDKYHVECKHVAGWKNMEQVIDTYVPQLHHVMHILGTNRCMLSVIFGTAEPSYVWVDKDEDYMSRLLEIEQQFWQMVEARIPPEEVEVISIPKPELVIDDMIECDNSTSNSWVDTAASYLDTKYDHAIHEVAKKDLKAMVPDNCRKMTGGGIVVTRNKRGSLLIKEAVNEKA
jgi:hypothetical protein